MKKTIAVVRPRCSRAPDAAPPRADEAAVRQAFQAKFPKMTVESVSKTPFPGIYEVVARRPDLLHRREGLVPLQRQPARHARRASRATSRRKRRASSPPRALAKSTDLAVKRVKGNGKRVIYTFEDPELRLLQGAAEGARQAERRDDLHVPVADPFAGLDRRNRRRSGARRTARRRGTTSC